MEHDSGRWTGGSDPQQMGRAEYLQRSHASRPRYGGDVRGRRWLFILLALLGIGAMITRLSSGKAYPACDNNAATAALANLYDNRRLLHATDISALRLLSDGVKGRYCIATVKWGNGSETEVHYEFYRSGRQNQYLSMWIDYNGGMRGPPL
jgi:hypothetical protein